MKIVFGILCGILYLIGLCFGLSYEEISIIICIYMCPAVCILCASAAAIYFRHIKSVANRLLFSLNASITLTYCCIAAAFWRHYRAAIDPFGYCADNLTWIAEDLNMTYEEVNIYIYCYLFFGIIIFHLGQIAIGMLIKKRRQAKLTAAA